MIQKINWCSGAPVLLVGWSTFWDRSLDGPLDEKQYSWCLSSSPQGMNHEILLTHYIN